MSLDKNINILILNASIDYFLLSKNSKNHLGHPNSNFFLPHYITISINITYNFPALFKLFLSLCWFFFYLFDKIYVNLYFQEPQYILAPGNCYFYILNV